MKILVFSDSHGLRNAMAETAKKEFPDLILHLGDRASDCEGLFSCRVVAVRGNCDSFSDEEETRFLDFGVTKIFMTHGHRFGVKTTLSRLLAEGEKACATVVLYGHTHVPYLSVSASCSVMNPGTPDRSYGVLELAADGTLTDIRLIEK